MGFLPESMFDYLKERPTAKKLLDAFFVITLFTWIAVVYMVATNFTTFQQVFKTQQVDVRSLIRLDKSINDELDHIMNATQSDRAALARFHDTVKDVQGNHFVYETRSNEAVQPGVSTATGLRQNLLVSMIAPWAQEFAQNKCVFTTNLKPADLYFAFYRQIGVKSDIKCPVNSISGNLIGFIYVEFTTRTLTIEELQQIEQQARASADKIGAILSVNGG